jgi:hypothetical protein
MLYVLYPFVTYLMALPGIRGTAGCKKKEQLRERGIYMFKYKEKWGGRVRRNES